MEQLLLPVPLQIGTKTVGQMSCQGQADQNSCNDSRLTQAGCIEALPLAGNSTIDNAPAAQRKENTQQGMAHI